MKKADSFWDRSATQYDRQSKRYEGLYSETIDRIQAHCRPNDHVLDFGCGTGLITLALAGRVQSITATDISEKMMQEAQKKASARGINNINFTQTPPEATVSPGSGFDRVVAANVLHFIPDIESTLSHLYALLKPGGLFISVTDCFKETRSPMSLMTQILSKARVLPALKAYRADGLKETVADAGFLILECEPLRHVAHNVFILAQKQKMD